MSAHVQLAEKFGALVAKEDYVAAHALLTREAQAAWPPHEMKRRSERMRSYDPGPFTSFQVMEEFVLEDWPAMEDRDVASIYISLEGEGFCEAVTVIVAEQDGHLAIRDLEWGRP